MTFVVADRIRDTSTSTGTGDFVVSGSAPSTYRTFSAVCSVADTLPYFIQNQSANEFEVGIGTYSASNTLSRTAVGVLSSSAGVGTLVTFSAGSKDVVLGIPARNAYAREVIEGDRTYYVRTDGSDSNTGLANTAGGAFLTIGQALTTVSEIDFNGNSVIIQVATGTYNISSGLVAPVCVGQVDTASFTLQGDTTTPSNVVVQSSSAISYILTNGIGARVSVGGFKFQSGAGNADNLVLARTLGHISFTGKMEYGSATTYQLHSDRANVSISADYTISAGTNTHVFASGQGQVVASGITVTLTGTPNFTGTFAGAEILSYVSYGSGAVTFSGSATGRRYTVFSNAVLNSNGGGANWFPGDVAGASGTGGQYI